VSVEPFGDVGSASAVCKCGAAAHPFDARRCANGHQRLGAAGLPAIVDAHTKTFWAAQADARREIAGAVIADAGHTEVDAPAVLRMAADSISQAVLIQTSAFQRLVESGGPLTASGRTRRAFTVWLTATDRLEKHLRLVGLRRAPKPSMSLQDYLATRQPEAAAGGAEHGGGGSEHDQGDDDGRQ
jgi:hypothetical protein